MMTTEEWIAKHLATAPPISDESRKVVEGILTSISQSRLAQLNQDQTCGRGTGPQATTVPVKGVQA